MDGPMYNRLPTTGSGAIMKAMLSKGVAYLGDAYLIARFALGRSGREYGISSWTKLKLALGFIRNTRKLDSLSNWRQHLLLVQEIFRLPKSLHGDVVECGCFNGASTVSLSRACALVGRRLFVCDSFEGLPAPKDNERYEVHGGSADYYLWEKGEFASEGGVEGVKRNVERFGDLEPCRFVKGFFSDTLGDIETDSVVLIFEDADLRSSVEDCLKGLWPKLQDGCKFFSHEPWSVQVVSLFYDASWWTENLDTHAPGFHGSGPGLVAGLAYATMGYAQKFDVQAVKTEGQKILHCGSAGFDQHPGNASGSSP